MKIEELLGREVIQKGKGFSKTMLNSKVILITGAAGSIGSEIARQLTSFNYKKLICIDQAESALYDLQQELIPQKNNMTVFIVADIRSQERMSKIIEETKPDIIFHSAGYKHVPLMENNPYEAVNTNVRATCVLMDLATKYNVETFVLISTDKAVNPVNVMGATKRIAEIYVQCLAKQSKTKFITTRFGNVLESNGSVIPLFKKQLLKGGPITVTHKEVSRYFMTISEACQLVLEAGFIGKENQIYVFDMGNPIRIYDLALKMIKMEDLDYPDDITIEIIGLRPGEKLDEELWSSKENLLSTNNKSIFIVEGKTFDQIKVKNKILKLIQAIDSSTDEEILKRMKEIVPEYILNYSI